MKYSLNYERKYHDLEDMVDRMELTDDENMDVFDMKYTSARSIGYTSQTRKSKLVILT